MARTGDHGRAEALIIAEVAGIVSRYASRWPLDVAGAVAELHTVTVDPHLLGHGWPPDAPQEGFAVFADPFVEQKREILRAAGADPQPRWWEEWAG